MNPTINDSLAVRWTVIQPEHLHGIDLKPPHAPAPLLGDHSVCDPPDPISNSAVKPDSADGTNAQALEE